MVEMMGESLEWLWGVLESMGEALGRSLRAKLTCSESEEESELCRRPPIHRLPNPNAAIPSCVALFRARTTVDLIFVREWLTTQWSETDLDLHVFWAMVSGLLSFRADCVGDESHGNGMKLGIVRFCRTCISGAFYKFLGTILDAPTFAKEFHKFCIHFPSNWYQSCLIRAPMAGRKVEVLKGEIGQLKSDCVDKISYFKKLFSAIHEKIDEKFAIMEEMMRKMLEFQTKMASSEAGEPPVTKGVEETLIR
ncbi:hypothetical protein IEQ34_015054 [Dendrobium chrysotoxum]|uniref:Uncharacterized protein n=1 Tax=Dendrobium chrysotoxum TaxID=161865 RepID=A0AAV7GMC0_DENCH|nr:hypothetical protein IEQ34_015054 [Dendrobium chrysotoxum]